MTFVQPRSQLAKIRPDVVFYAHQVEGVRKLATKNSFILADDMGLGKSLQALVVAAIDFERGWASRVLILCPKTLKGNWAKEIQDHTLFRAEILQGDYRQRQLHLEDLATRDDWDILISNYEQVDKHRDSFNALGFDIAIYDEAHALKGYRPRRRSRKTGEETIVGSLRGDAAMGVEAGRHFVLTGSPLLNYVPDLWPLLHRCDPKCWPSYWAFTHRYCTFGGYKGKQPVATRNKRELTELLNHYMVRRRKADVLDLPEKQYVPIYVELTPTQRDMYDEIENELRLTIPNNPTPLEVENALVKFGKLLMIADTPACIDGFKDDSLKLDRVAEMCEEIIGNGEPVVIFTQFRVPLACTVARLRKLGLQPFELHGDVPDLERVPIVNTWTTEAQRGNPQPLVCSIKVAGVGLNMTAASKCIFVDKLFVPKLNEQAEDRLHRIGASTSQAIQIYSMIALGSVEARVQQILKIKTKVFNEVIENETDWKRRLVTELVKDYHHAA